MVVLDVFSSFLSAPDPVVACFDWCFNRKFPEMCQTLAFLSENI